MFLLEGRTVRTVDQLHPLVEQAARESTVIEENSEKQSVAIARGSIRGKKPETASDAEPDREVHW